jgi:hypothetical protein
MLDLGFVHAQEGDADNIPDQPVEEEFEDTECEYRNYQEMDV